MLKVTIMGSGRGSNAEAILAAQTRGELGNACVVRIISDQPTAGILGLGERYGVAAIYIDPAPFRTKLEGEAEDRYIREIHKAETDLVVLAGFMRVLKPKMLGAFPNRIINLHPSLLPSFPGLDAIGQAWRSGVRFTGCTVHFVSGEVDGGRIVDQEVVRIVATDTLEGLTARVHEAEHLLLPRVIARISRGELASR